jgi:polyisoprenoid-binding protein YceI
LGDEEAEMKTAVLVWACLLAPSAAEVESPRAARFAIDTQRSTISWELPATLHTVAGTAPEFSGSIELETGPGGEHVVRGRVSVRAAAMKTGNESRDQKMREKVLEVDRYPEIVFDLDAVEADWSKLAGGSAFDAKVSGRLTVHGTALALQVAVSVEPSGDGITLSGSFPLRWKSYGLSDPSFGFVTVREPMKVVFRLRAAPSEAPPK